MNSTPPRHRGDGEAQGGKGGGVRDRQRFEALRGRLALAEQKQRPGAEIAPEEPGEGPFGRGPSAGQGHYSGRLAFGEGPGYPVVAKRTATGFTITLANHHQMAGRQTRS